MKRRCNHAFVLAHTCRHCREWLEQQKKQKESK